MLVTQIRQVNRKPYLTTLREIVPIHLSKHMISEIQTRRLIDNHFCALQIEKAWLKFLHLS